MKALLFPGQGAQFKGMGRGLFQKFPVLTQRASEILGYSIEELCTGDPGNNLTKTEYTQPAIYVTNALTFYDQQQGIGRVDFAAGHSLGEYNALLAAEVFSFEEGLELVKLRGRLMGEAKGGGMAAVLGLSPAEVAKVLAEAQLSQVEIANFNTPTQSVISGPKEVVVGAERFFTKAGARFVLLNVGAAFHSRFMRQAQEVFSAQLAKMKLRPPKTTVIANLTARPYEAGSLAQTLGQQIASPVRWMDSMIYLFAQGDVHCTEVGGVILTKMVDEIRSSCSADIQTTKAAQCVSPQPKAPTSRYFQPW